MTKAYIINDLAVWTGEVREIDLEKGRPFNAILAIPPTFDSTKSFAVWSGSNWIVRPLSQLPSPVNPIPQQYYVPTYLIRQRAEKIGVWDDLSAYLVQYPALMLKTLTLETGIDPKDPDLIKGFTDLSMPQSAQDYLLSDPSLGV